MDRQVKTRSQDRQAHERTAYAFGDAEATKSHNNKNNNNNNNNNKYGILGGATAVGHMTVAAYQVRHR